MRIPVSFLLGAAILSPPCSARGRTLLTQEGKPKCTVVTPPDCSPTVAFAAKELVKYLHQISDATAPIVEAGKPVSGTPVYLGSAAPGGAARSFTNPETIFYRIADGNVVISGGSDRGVLFAVYRFLEQVLGCRWLAPDVEFVPKRPTVALDEDTFSSPPAFDMRTFVARRQDCRTWGVKRGMNGFYTKDGVPLTGGGYYLPRQVPGCHAYSLLIPARKYFSPHPEWFPLLNGKRVTTQMHNAQLCVTAPGLADEFARNVLRLFAADPTLRAVSISPNDGYGWCQCSACQALDEKLCGGRTTQQGLAGERPFRGDRVFWFANEVARRVAEVYPDKLLLVLAYVNYAEPPDTIRPASNVVPWLCHYAPADYSRPIHDPTSTPNKQFDSLLRRWAKRAPHLLFYSYVSKSMWWRLPRPVVHNFAADIKYLHRLGIHRYYCQSSLADWALDGPLYYVITGLLWDPDADPDTLAADWVRHMFGPAASAMHRYYAAVDRSIRESHKSFSDHPPRDVPGLFAQSDLDEALRSLHDAQRLAQGDPVVAARVEKVAQVFQYGYHMIRCLEATRLLSEQPTKALRQQALAEGRRALSFCRVGEAKKFLDSLRMTEELGVLGAGFGDPMTLGGRRCWNSDETGPGDHAAGWATLMIPTPDTTKPVRLEMDVWGASQLDAVVVNTGGQRKGYSAGGVWNPVKPVTPLSGEKRWETLTFVLPPRVLARDKKVQTIGFGGGDSQIWIAHVRVAAGK